MSSSTQKSAASSTLKPAAELARGVHAAPGSERFHNQAFLGRRDERCLRRPRTGPARRAGPDADLDDFGRHAGRAWDGLVSETQLLSEY